MAEQKDENYIVKDRQNKLKKLGDLGIEAYPAVSNKSKDVSEVLKDFTKLKGKKVVLAGRVRAKRGHGKLSFMDIEDGTGRIQGLLKADALGENFDLVELIDIGDFVEVEGIATLSKRGEKSIEAKKLKLLSKSIRPLPEKREGLKDPEERYRKRYLDLISNPETKELFVKRAKFIEAVRQFMVKHGFFEVETPVLETVPGGADANPFTTHHDALDNDFYLRISLELHLKRLIVGGFDKVFEIGRVFRNEGISTQHLQEFTMMECYWAYADYEELMKFVEEMYTNSAKEVFGTLDFEWQGKKFSMKGPWKKVDYVEIFKKETGIDLDKIKDKKELRKAVKKLKLEDIDLKLNYGRLVDQVYKRLVRPKLKGPLFLINHPIEISPLAKKHRKLPGRVERFQVLLLGAEVGNAFSELNDPVDQRARFEEQMKMRKSGDAEAQMMDEEYVTALEYGMPPTGGFGVGIDRLFMYLAGKDSIRDVVFFPMVRPR